jgi:YD repeat-containing protein
MHLTGVASSRFVYDAGGRLISSTDADGNMTSIVRAADGTPQEILGPYGQHTRLTFDPGGYLAGIRAPGGETVVVGYDSLGLMTTRTDGEGGAHRFTYDAAGLLESDRNAGGLTQTLATVATASGKGGDHLHRRCRRRAI